MWPDRNQVYRRTEDLPFRTVGEETVVVNTRTREVHVLNGTGSRIWTLLSPARSVADLMEALNREFELEAPLAQDQATAFVEELVDKGLVSVAR